MCFKPGDEAKVFPLVVQEEDSEKEFINHNRSIGKMT